MKRFKIDARQGRSWPYGLFVRRRCWHTRITNIWWWEEVDSFETAEMARAHYEKIKSLPEYLD
jgi:hypothetical protein